ncbi:hypothetical protein [Streptomyces sp. NPDC004042]|uniref:hypothetical protein n=1 Tax=Streptomyces sp. NPDC004042 TaxID=3154451 RepID=UPI0033A6227B
MEGQLGTELFTRRAQGVALTPAGAAPRRAPGGCWRSGRGARTPWRRRGRRPAARWCWA